MPTVLESIVAGAREDLAVRQAAVSLDQLKERAARQPSAQEVVTRLRRSESVTMIAEIKRQGIAKGDPALSHDPARFAADCQDGGATMISIITERRRFAGSLADLAAIRAAVDIPVLHKDFITTTYQLWEARACGADAVLLIVAAMDQLALESLVERSHSLGMTAIVEAHTADEVKRALDAGALVISVNARDLKTPKVDRTIFRDLAPLIPDRVVRLADSGVRGPHDVMEYARAGADAVLVGRALLAGGDPKRAIKDLVAAGQHPSLWAVRPACRS
ncbi:MAG: indole-3-glycerol phosphate synthase TrpC [Promicromonosporaceae bacterium]|nr:indole-3-glycerol phosphate synthase TrpC [Promicromonosporaceae bacterium]